MFSKLNRRNVIFSTVPFEISSIFWIPWNVIIIMLHIVPGHIHILQKNSIFTALLCQKICLSQANQGVYKNKSLYDLTQSQPFTKCSKWDNGIVDATSTEYHRCECIEDDNTWTHNTWTLSLVCLCTQQSLQQELNTVNTCTNGHTQILQSNTWI